MYCNVSIVILSNSHLINHHLILNAFFSFFFFFIETLKSEHEFIVRLKSVLNNGTSDMYKVRSTNIFIDSFQVECR